MRSALSFSKTCVRPWPRIVTGYDDDDNPAFQWDVGLDTRLLFLIGSAEVGSVIDFIVIPMLIEPQLVWPMEISRITVRSRVANNLKRNDCFRGITGFSIG